MGIAAHGNSGFHPAPIERAEGLEFPRMARRLFGNVRLEFEGRPEKESSLVSARLGVCRLSRLAAGRHIVRGERVLAGSDAPDMIKLIIQTEGHSTLLQGGLRLPVGPSSVVIYDPANPYVLINPGAVELLMLQVPRSAIGPGEIGRIRKPLAAALVPGGMHRILQSLMGSTMDEMETLDESARESLGQTMLELVRGMVSAAGDPLEQPRSLDLLRARIKDYIAANLARTELGAPEIARRMGCSLRYVYRAFEAEGMSPADYIWAERLRAAAELLRTAPQAPGFVGDVAFSLGFSSSAHFSRAFRNRFQQTPSQWCRAR